MLISPGALDMAGVIVTTRQEDFDKITEEKTQNILWVENDITYNLLDMGVEIDKNDFINMAKEVINQK